MHHNRRLQHLFEKYLDDSLSESEQAEFYRLLAEHENDEAVKTMISREIGKYDAGAMIDVNELPAARAREIFGRMTAKEADTAPASLSTPVRRIWLRWAAAAAAVLVISIALYRSVTTRNVAKEKIVQNEFNYDVAPGRNNAILTLSDGTKIDLDSAGTGNLAREGQTNISKAGSHIQYNFDGGIAATHFNTISTARGNQYMVVLSDGTKVWLNAASSITFPAAFTGSDRQVKVSGEAYFEVAKKKNMPFRVSFAGDGEITVLGTHFNVSSYADDPLMKTTLLEGSVRISKDGDSELMKPGDQAQIRENATMKIVPDVDVEEAIAWKNGFFSFRDADIKTVMRHLSRWYDLDIIYEGEPGRQLFTGEIDRSLNLVSVLKILDKTKVHFRMEQNKKLVIMP